MFKPSGNMVRAICFADGWFEWKREGDKKQPYFIHRKDCKYPGKADHSHLEIFLHTVMFPEEIAMRKARFTEHQIIAVLGVPVEAGTHRQRCVPRSRDF